MALRIRQSVVRGEIDNRRRGRVEGWITLVGVERPLMLELTGNCLRDLAGSVVRFENPHPLATEDEKNLPAPLQRGVAGEITASRKVRVLDVPLEEATRLTRSGTQPPEHSANALYLEWFSEANGRVVIESSDYEIDVSPAEWKLSPEMRSSKLLPAMRRCAPGWNSSIKSICRILKNGNLKLRMNNRWMNSVTRSSCANRTRARTST